MLFFIFDILEKGLLDFFKLFIAPATTQNPIQKANTMFLSKEATNKDQSIKIQMMLSLDKSDSSNTEKISKKNGFLEIKILIKILEIKILRNLIFLKTPWFIAIKAQFQL